MGDSMSKTHVKQTSSIHIVAIVIVDIAESTGVATGKDYHLTFEHLNEMAGFISLGEANLYCLAGHFVI